MNYASKLRRVVITGMGVIAPNGSDLKTFWANVRNGQSAGGQVTRFDTKDMPAKVAAEIRNFDPMTFISRKKVRRLSLANQYAVAAAKKAVEDACLDVNQLDKGMLGVAEGTSVGCFEGTIAAHNGFMSGGYRRVTSFAIMNSYSGSGSGEVAEELGAKGPVMSVCSGSASGNDAVGCGCMMIRTGEADVMVVGGSEAPLIEQIWAGFCMAGVTTRGIDPCGSMKPFDVHRDGFLLGEGAAFLVLEDLQHALDRGVRIYAEILGHGRCCEAYHPLAPNPEGIGVKAAITKALTSARVSPDDVDYINAHGTATVLNDVAETLGIKAYFGERASQIAISSTKPVTGHLLGASGAIESIICAIAINQQEVPPTLNLSEPSNDCDLDYVQYTARKLALNVVLNLSSGFGGRNSCLVIGRFDKTTTL